MITTVPLREGNFTTEIRDLKIGAKGQNNLRKGSRVKDYKKLPEARHGGTHL